MSNLEELLEKKKAIEAKILTVKQRMGINSGARYGDEFADQEFRVLNAYLEEVQRAILALKGKR